jgi:hypothetical protein
MRHIDLVHLRLKITYARIALELHLLKNPVGPANRSIRPSSAGPSPFEVRTASGRKRDAGPRSQNTSRVLTGKLGEVNGCCATFTFLFLALFSRNLAGCFLFGGGFILLSKQLHDLLFS